jgi:hypothetical protein
MEAATINNTAQQLTLKDDRKLGFAEYGTPRGYLIVYIHGSQSSRLEMHYDVLFANQNDLRTNKRLIILDMGFIISIHQLLSLIFTRMLFRVC